MEAICPFGATNGLVTIKEVLSVSIELMHFTDFPFSITIPSRSSSETLSGIIMNYKFSVRAKITLVVVSETNFQSVLYQFKHIGRNILENY